MPLTLAQINDPERDLSAGGRTTKYKEIQDARMLDRFYQNAPPALLENLAGNWGADGSCGLYIQRHKKSQAPKLCMREVVHLAAHPEEITQDMVSEYSFALRGFLAKHRGDWALFDGPFNEVFSLGLGQTHTLGESQGISACYFSGRREAARAAALAPYALSRGDQLRAAADGWHDHWDARQFINAPVNIHLTVKDEHIGEVKLEQTYSSHMEVCRIVCDSGCNSPLSNLFKRRGVQIAADGSRSLTNFNWNHYIEGDYVCDIQEIRVTPDVELDRLRHKFALAARLHHLKHHPEPLPADADARLTPALKGGFVTGDGHLRAQLALVGDYKVPDDATAADLQPAALYCSIYISQKAAGREILLLWARRYGLVASMDDENINWTSQCGGCRLRYPVFNYKKTTGKTYVSCAMYLHGDAVFQEIEAYKEVAVAAGFWQAEEKRRQYDALLDWADWRNQPDSPAKRKEALRIARLLAAEHQHRGEEEDEEVQEPDPALLVEFSDDEEDEELEEELQGLGD